MQAEIVSRIVDVLAKGVVQDHFGYEALAFLKMPGPHYLDVLGTLHHGLRPKLYVEIGTREGHSLRLALPETKCVAIDPKPADTLTAEFSKRDLFLSISTSDAFFAREDAAKRANGFDLAFIDGDHSFSQALRDFENLERLAKPSSIIAIHDVIPMDDRTSTAHCASSFWTGDVWRLMAAIVADRPDLIAFTVACPPTGLGIVGRFNAEPKGISDTAIGAANMLLLKSNWEWQRKTLNIVGNDAHSIREALGAA